MKPRSSRRLEGGEAFDSFVSDPHRPVPYRQRPIPETYGGSPGWSTWHTDDQRFAENRPDVAVWQTKPLESDITVAGDVIADLFASTSGTDSDWVVKLIDVYPDSVPEDPPLGGYELMIGADVLRGRFRNGFEKPEPVVPNEPSEYRTRSAIAWFATVFKKRTPHIALQVQTPGSRSSTVIRRSSFRTSSEAEGIRFSKSRHSMCVPVQDACFVGRLAGPPVKDFAVQLFSRLVAEPREPISAATLGSKISRANPERPESHVNVPLVLAFVAGQGTPAPCGRSDGFLHCAARRR